MGSSPPEQEAAAAGAFPTPEQRAQQALAEVRAGRKEAFSEIVELYQDDVMTLSLTLMWDRTEAEELTQDVFVRAYRYLDSFDDRRPFRPWLAKITYRLAQSRRQQRAREAARRDVALSKQVVQSDDDPLSILLADEQARRLWLAVHTLPDRERAAVVLYYRNALRVSEVAQAMGVSTGTVKTFLIRARRHLGIALGPSDQRSTRRPL